MRNKLDLNVTAMPVKYRRMADFHEYYSGTRVAPYLTIFVGGNHEASNQLFELYYGGWVAPNIYYMGVANILRFGPLRIAALSGIWKGYDYNKPHFERLPYNNDDIQSIYHVREIDVRKLLSVRTQVDIGMSHDWPQGIEWAGNHQWLFKKKDLFYADAMSGKLGSVAAKQCLDRLRPKHWFSSHLHIKYAAVLEHGDYQPVRPVAPRTGLGGPRRLDPASDAANPEDKPATPADDVDEPSASTSIDRANTQHQNSNKAPERSNHASQVSAWQNFHTQAAADDAAELERYRKEEDARKAEEAVNGADDVAPYQFEETWKKVEVGDGFNRDVTSVSKTTDIPASKDIPSYDGCLESKVAHDESERLPIIRLSNDYEATQTGQPDPRISLPSGVRNQDEIDVDMDDSSSEGGVPARTQDAGQIRLVPNEVVQDSSSASFTDEGIKLSSSGSSGRVTQRPQQENGNAAALQSGTVEEPMGQDPQKSAPLESVERKTAKPSEEDGITADMRAELASLSSNFKPAVPVKISASLPLPEEIANKVTEFLALDKCEPNRDFLQLLEILPIASPESVRTSRPLKLEYDPEWLAIQRVFADDLDVGGDPRGSAPQNLGDTHYREKILEEEKWVGENVVLPGKLSVPENFCQTAPVFDPQSRHQESEMPREYPNPQTEDYCKLLGIENKFSITEDAINDRIARGPRFEKEGFNRGGRGRGGHGHGRGGFGGRGGNRGGRGRGRGGGRRW